jgi:two-component system sensor histidine kinase TtrS
MIRTALRFLLLVLLPASLGAQTITVAVIAIHGNEQAGHAWSPTIGYLQQKLPKYQFELLPVPPKEVDRLKELIDAKQVDFVISQPAIYVDLELSNGISRILTMIDKAGAAEFGSVIIARSDDPINYLNQVKYRDVAAVAPLGFGGWLIGYNEMLRYGVDPDDVFFAGTQQNVVKAVLEKRSDVGVIRTGVLEKLSAKGFDTSSLKILAQKSYEGFPYQVSTALYPEWAFAKTRHISNGLAKEIALSILEITPQSDAARAAGYHSWTMPYNYQPVHDLMKELRAGPYKEYGRVTISEFIVQHKAVAILLFTLLASLAVFLFYSQKMRRNLQEYVDIVDENITAYQIDTNGNLTHGSSAFFDLSGHTEESIEGISHFKLFHPDFSRAQYKKIITTVKSGRQWHGELPFRTRQKEDYWVEALFSPIYGKEEEIDGFSVILHDISEKKKNETHEGLLLHQSRLAQMGELITMIAHQWRQPLNIIGLGMTQLETAKQLDKLDDTLFEKVTETVKDQIHYMSHTIDDFRKFFHQDKELTHVNLHTQVDETIALVGELLNYKEITISNHTDRSVEVDLFSNEFKQVLINIFNNSCDALTASDVTEKQIEITSCLSRNGQLTVTVSDNGGGIDPEIIDKIFEPYFTTKFESQGTGLGLYMSKLIIEEHMHGSLHAENSGDGAAFVITFPSTRT